MESKNVSIILATDGKGRYLLGKRRDNNLWTVPGGHLEEGEDPSEGARRELFEETNLKPTSLTHYTSEQMPNGGVLYCYTALISSGIAHSKNDPDQECEKWEWIDCRGGIPNNIWENLHGPEGDKNMVRRLFDLQKKEENWINGRIEFLDLEKSTSTLLRHPHHVERKLALKMGSITAGDVAKAILDPHPEVWKTAFNHPLSQKALKVLASTTRDLSGETLFDRHDALMADSRCKPWHVKEMFTAVEEDGYLPESEKAKRIIALTHCALTSNLKKAEEHDRWMKGKTTTEPAVDTSKEKNMPHHGEYVDSFMKHVHQEGGVATTSHKFKEGEGGIDPKLFYDVPHRDGSYKAMVKPYHLEDNPLSGWAEATTQELYHSSGIGHLHQKTFVVPHGNGDNRTDSTAVVMEQAKSVSDVSNKDIDSNPTFSSDARKIAMMDFLTGNNDRHDANLMVRKDGSLMAIDHGGSFGYEKDYSKNSFGESNDWNSAHEHIGYDQKDYHHDALPWWKENSSKVRNTFNKRLELISNPEEREVIAKHFNARAKWLDKQASQKPIHNWSYEKVVV